jgi:hypothetical protein
MNVHERVKLPNLGNLEIDVSALYLIAAPSFPEPVGAEITTRAENGEVVTHGMVCAVMVEWKRAGEAVAAGSDAGGRYT